MATVVRQGHRGPTFFFSISTSAAWKAQYASLLDRAIIIRHPLDCHLLLGSYMLHPDMVLKQGDPRHKVHCPQLGHRCGQAQKEGRKFTHPWQPTKLNGWTSVCVSVARHCVKASYIVPDQRCIHRSAGAEELASSSHPASKWDPSQYDTRA